VNCLVFGGGGFIGSHICDELITQGHNVKVFGKSGPDDSKSKHLINNVEWYLGDFTQKNDIKHAMENVDFIFHSLSTTVPKSSNDDPAMDIQSNLISTVNMLEVARENNVKKIIFISSGGTVYGIPKEIPISETHSTMPISSYGIQKLAIEKYLQLYHYLYGLDYGVLRVSNPYGERQPSAGQQGVIGVFLEKAVNNEPIEVWGDGTVIRDYIYVTDVAKAAIAVMNNTSIQKIFNVGSGQGRSLLEIIGAIEENLGHPIKVNYKASRATDVPINVLNISKAREILSWYPTINFNEGLIQTMASSKGY
jgi:UDP-glucose 4-epimerase